MLEFILDPIFQPLFNLNPFYAVAIISLGITVLITLIYKYTTDQTLMKSLKADMKKSQQELKKNKDDPKKMMGLQKKAMEKNMQYMKHSMKSTLYTMIPIIIIFGYLNSHLSYNPISPGEEFMTSIEFEEGVTGEVELLNNNLEVLDGRIKEIEESRASWRLRGEKGDYVLEYDYKGDVLTQDLLITDERKYEDPEKRSDNPDVDNLQINNKKIIVMNLFGWKLGWLGTYIILSIIFSTLLRKFLKIA